MSVVEFLALLAAGLFAGTINTVVGAGTLVTFPTLLFFGYPPVVANISNNIGLIPGGVTGAYGYRDELRGHPSPLPRLVPMSLAGGVIGALLLLVLPRSVFEAVVPALIAVGVLLVLFGPWLQRQATKRHTDLADGARRDARRDLMLRGGMFLSGMYGGYFGAAQGVLMMGLLSVLTTDPLQRLNAVKNVLGTVVNAAAAVVFLAVAFDQVDWAAAGAIAAGSLLGGVVGARVGRKLSPPVLRAVIVVIGATAIARLVSS